MRLDNSRRLLPWRIYPACSLLPRATDRGAASPLLVSRRHGTLPIHLWIRKDMLCFWMERVKEHMGRNERRGSNGNCGRCRCRMRNGSRTIVPFMGRWGLIENFKRNNRKKFGGVQGRVNLYIGGEARWCGQTMIFEMNAMTNTRKSRALQLLTVHVAVMQSCQF